VKVNFPLAEAFFAGEEEKLAAFVKSLIKEELEEQDFKAFLEADFRQTVHLLKVVRENYRLLRERSLEVLASGGFAPSEEQQVVLEKVLRAVREGEEKVFIVRGEPGSGKSYLAILLLLKAFSGAAFRTSKNRGLAVLAYRNNRLINTLRRVFDEVAPGLSALIRFSSTRDGAGVADENPYFYRLAVFDEAQRLTRQQIRRAVKKGKVVVFFYDEKQRLNPEEGGTTEAFEGAARAAGKKAEKFELKGFYRVADGEVYHRFVDRLLEEPLSAKLPPLPRYRLELFTDAEDLLKALRRKAEEGFKVALVAAFTESPGDRKNKQGKTLLNRRLGYPLYTSTGVKSWTYIGSWTRRPSIPSSGMGAVQTS